ncbi:MAG: NADH-quinone oxidoreductase subunit NuoK [Candidatus Omnitrophica bacterium]|nr:NADH-quinone oxidoreductase subunit NuoK [Candidatus Omnitrophota bacterium]
MIPPVGPSHYLVLSGLLFAIGLAGAASRRNIIMILLSLELILSAANLAFVTFSKILGNLEGQIMVFFVMIVAAAEVAVGLAIAVVMVRRTGKSDADSFRNLKW